MIDRNKVIKGLEECAGNGNCTKCQYGKEKQTLTCRKLLADALELIKSERVIHTEHTLYTVYESDIVRCKDCRKNMMCEMTIHKPRDWYCADGERKEGR